MITYEMKTRHQAIVQEYPRSDILILSSDGHILHAYTRLHIADDYAAQPDFLEERTDEASHRAYYRIQMGLTDRIHLLFLCFAEEETHPEKILRFVMLLKQGLASETPDAPFLPYPEKYLFLMDQLMNKYSNNNEYLILRLAEECSIDMSVPRVVCLLDLGSFRSGQQFRKAGVIPGLIYQLESRNLVSGKDLLYSESENELILIREVNPGIALKQQLSEDLQSIQSAVAAYLQGRVRIAVGITAVECSSYQQSYQIARSLLNIKYGKASILYTADMALPLLLEFTPVKTLEHFFSERVEVLRENPEFFDTIHALIESDMNISRAAEQNHMHRNTMLLHTNRLRDSLTLDPINREGDRLTTELLYYYYLSLHSNHER